MRSHWDLAWSLWDPSRSPRDLTQSLQDPLRSLQISLRFGLISLRSTEISSRSDLILLRSTMISLRSGQIQQKPVDFGKIRRRFLQNLVTIHTVRNWSIPDRKPMASDHSNRCLQQVNGESRFRRPKVIGSISGWAQTRFGLTRGQTYL